MQEGSPSGCFPGFPPTDAWLQSGLQAEGQPRAAIPTAQGGSAPALTPACTLLPLRMQILHPAALSLLLLSVRLAGRTWLRISLQMGSSGLWKGTGTGMLECPVWTNTSDFG